MQERRPPISAAARWRWLCAHCPASVLRPLAIRNWEADICTPHIDPPKPLPERQSLVQPDKGATAPRIDDEIRRRRAMMATAYSGQTGLGAPAGTTNTLGA